MSAASFTILGSSSGLPQATRACSGYVLQTGESLSLIDCGGGVAGSFLRLGFAPHKLDRIFISHTHSDHCCELSLVIQMLHVLRSERRLDIFIPDEFIRPFLAWLNAVYLFPQHLTPDLHLHGYADGFVYHGDGFDLTAIANQHLEKAADLIEQYDVPNRMQCHSFRITTAAKTLFYSADVAGRQDLATHLDGLDYALIESTHVELDQVLRHARNSAGVKYVLTHLGNEAEVADLAQQIDASGLENIILAEDGLRLSM
jgi:ribonuclease BN (tRNA processing enzyme)